MSRRRRAAQTNGCLSANYMGRALEDECEKVRNAAKGEANSTLHRAAVALGTLLPCSEVTREQIERSLLEAARGRGKSNSEARATIKSGLDWGEEHPRDSELLSREPWQQEHGPPKVLKVWQEAEAATGSLVECYWRSRGLAQPIPDVIRFAPIVSMPDGSTVPAMVAAVRNPMTGALLAVQRTALLPDGTGKADLPTTKAALGKTAGGAVVLGELVTSAVILEGEGIETVASACEATGLVGIATLSAGTLGKPSLPESAAVIILGERGSERAAEAGAMRRRGEGRKVRIAYPPEHGGKDFNDVLRTKGRSAVRDAIFAGEGEWQTAQTRQPNYDAVCLADIEPEPVRWLWHNKIARGKLNMLAGHPGRGKSTLTLYLASLVSTGGHWPDGSLCDAGSVVLITCEDDAADTLVPRLMAMKADRSRIHLFNGSKDEEGKPKPFDLVHGLRGLAEFVASIPNPSLIIIDPIGAYLDRVDSHSNADVRGALRPLQDLAREKGAAVLMVSHFNKGTLDNSAMSRISGSGAFVAVCRSAWLVERDPEDEPRGNKRLLVPIKNNIGNDAEGFRFAIEPVEIDREISSSRIDFMSGGVTITADELLRGSSGKNDQPSRLEQACQFLRECLRGGAKAQSEVVRAARAEGHSATTINRAKRDVGIESRKIGPEWVWALPAGEGTGDLFAGQGGQGFQGGHNSKGGLDGSLANGAVQHGQQPDHTGVGHLGYLGNLAGAET